MELQLRLATTNPTDSAALRHLDGKSDMDDYADNHEVPNRGSLIDNPIDNLVATTFEHRETQKKGHEPLQRSEPKCAEKRPTTIRLRGYGVKCSGWRRTTYLQEATE